MERITSQAHAEAIGEALRVVGRYRHRIGPVEFLTGVDPVFAGLHSFGDTGDGRSYGDTPHCAYPWHIDGPADRRVTTIVLPQPEPPWVIVHELGHALDAAIGFRHSAVPVTAYARTNRLEAFAEAFTAQHYIYGDRDAFLTDAPTLALFRGLGGDVA